MKISLIIILTFYSFNLVAQPCEKQLEALRTEGRKLAEDNNALMSVNDRLRALLVSSIKDKVLEEKNRILIQKLNSVKADRDFQRTQLREKNLRIAKLKKESILVTAELMTLYVERDTLEHRLIREESKFAKLEHTIKLKEDTIASLKSELADYRKVFKELDDEEKDRVYFNSKMVVFKGKGVPFGKTIFTAHYKWNDREFSSRGAPASPEDQIAIARIAKLVSRHSDLIKIHLVVGSRVNDNGYRESRERDLKGYMMTFPTPQSPTSLSEANFSKSDMVNTSTYDIHIQIVKK